MLAAETSAWLVSAPAPRRACTARPAAAGCSRRAVCVFNANVEAAQSSDVPSGRRQLLSAVAGAALLAAAAGVAPVPAAQAIAEYEPMPGLQGKDYGKTRMKFSDYIETPSGLQYQDIKEGEGPTPLEGQTCVVDWSGVTIGYYGRPFEARNKPKGSAFDDDDKDFFRFKLGEHKVIPAFEEAVAGMQVGGIRRIIVPVELGYPDNDFNKAGPKPTTFSGKRALGFVLGNQGLIDKTLLFTIRLVAIRD